MKTFNHELGVRLRCNITGFEGLATGRMQYINGCVQYLVKPPVDKDGKMREGEWIDEAQLTKVDEGIRTPPVAAAASATKGPGGPIPELPKG